MGRLPVQPDGAEESTRSIDGVIMMSDDMIRNDETGGDAPASAAAPRTVVDPLRRGGEPGVGTIVDRPPLASPANETVVDSLTPGRTAPGILEGNIPTSYSRVNLPPGLAARYRVVRELPGGAEADVILVVDLLSAEERVVKLYRSRSTSLDDRMLALVQGDESLPHVVRSYEWGTDHGAWFEIQEYVANGSLGDLLHAEGAPLGEARVGEILLEVVSALEHVHRLGIVHRDLKPQNVLVRVTAPLDLVLADFGLATLVENERTMRSGSRTPAYAAPEASWGDVSPARDWWSVGIVLVEILTGSHPFRRADGLGWRTPRSGTTWRRVPSTSPGSPMTGGGCWRAVCWCEIPRIGGGR